MIVRRHRVRMLPFSIALAVAVTMVGAETRAQQRIQRFLQQRQELLEQRERERQQRADPQISLPKVDGLDPWLRQLHQCIPQLPSDFRDNELAKLQDAAAAVESWSAEWGRIGTGRPVGEHLEILERLLDVKSSVDLQLDHLLSMRADVATLDKPHADSETVRRYLRTSGRLVDLSGRLRYLLVDVIGDVAYRAANDAAMRDRFIDLLATRESHVGAQVMAAALFDPSPDDQDSPPPLSESQKLRLIDAIAASGNFELVDDLGSFLLDEQTPPVQVLAAARAVRELGLPQDPRPEQDPTLPRPIITAGALRDRLRAIRDRLGDQDDRAQADELIAWLSRASERGLDGDSYRLGKFEIRPGDWLLMRNPSPYNLFTDLSPGLFTHVGVVAAENGSDGMRRMVIVDLPERGTSMPATNVDAFLDRTLHYVFLRHQDGTVGEKMGYAAASMIGNPTEFDLNFRTDRIAALTDVPLRGKKIHTYCAGLLLLCAQQTGESRENFFPITETTAGGNTQANLATLGLSLGEGFVSPTGALFSSRLQLVGRSEPMYDPRREIEEAIFDHFAEGMELRQLNPSSDAFQSLRLKLAEASKDNPLLAKALAASAGVSEEMDLVSAAKAAAVVESLDEIAFGASRDFLSARAAIMYGAPPASTSEEQDGIDATQIALRHRREHANLVTRWESGQLSPRRLRMELVDYYIARGRQQIDRHFFSAVSDREEQPTRVDSQSK